MNLFKMVETFNKEVIGVPTRHLGTMQDDTEFRFLVGSLQEEITELEDAKGQDFVEEIDALMDIIYFAMGGLTRMGVPAILAEDIFYAIHIANMNKKGGRKEDREVSHDLDAVKPEGWIAPNEVIMGLIEKYNENRS